MRNGAGFIAAIHRPGWAGTFWKLAVAWKLQEKALGGLGAALKRRLAELATTMATTGDLAKARAVTLRPGAKLVREWHGEAHEVLVVDDGFEWRGERWRSLTAIAGTITGTHWSGPRFFGLGAPGKSSAEAAATVVGDKTVGRPVVPAALGTEADHG